MSTSFFAFGPNDGYFSRSFEGIKHHHLPRKLLLLLQANTIDSVHHVAFGPDIDSWIVSYTDYQQNPRLTYGDAIPKILKRHLSIISPSKHLYVSLGPNSSFFLSHPTSIRWSHLPSTLEETLQSWLSPSGWLHGSPRYISLSDNAWVAISDYGTAAYSPLSVWELLQETLQEWEAEPGFSWENVAYLTLDPSHTDQFFAIRNDGTWAGSIGDGNEDALEEFAAAFFSRPRKKEKKKKPEDAQANGDIPQKNDVPAPELPNPAIQALYEKWATEVATVFAAALAARNQAASPSISPIPSTAQSPSPPPLLNTQTSQSSFSQPQRTKTPKKLEIRKKTQSFSSQPSSASPRSSVDASTGIPAGPPPALLTTFPYPPPITSPCHLPQCTEIRIILKSCRHDLEILFKASGLYSYEWLRQERLRWHPDRFGRLCEEGWREQGKKVAEEMWKVCEGLCEDLEGKSK